jgi:hypothetical protein
LDYDIAEILKSIAAVARRACFFGKTRLVKKADQKRKQEAFRSGRQDPGMSNIRDEGELSKGTIYYNNPVKSGLMANGEDWPVM